MLVSIRERRRTEGNHEGRHRGWGVVGGGGVDKVEQIKGFTLPQWGKSVVISYPDSIAL